MSEAWIEKHDRHVSTVQRTRVAGAGAPAVPRRVLLGGAALGITATVLPAVTAAASGPTPESESDPGEPLAYATGSGPLLYWEPFDTTGISSSPSSASEGLASSGDAPVTGRHRRWGASFAAVSAVDGDESILSAWDLQNAGGLETLVTDASDIDDNTRGIRWELTNTSDDATVEVASLVLYRVRNAGATSGPLRLAFYANGLRRTIELTHDITRHVVIPLEGRTVAPGATLAVTAFPYGTDTTRELQLLRYDSTIGNVDGALVPLDAIDDAIQPDVVGEANVNSSERSYTVAFIGRVLSP